MTFICKVSGGVGSYLAARRVAEKFGHRAVRLVFTDTMIEDQDAYRFLLASASRIFEREVLVPAIEDFPAWENRAAYKAFLMDLRRSMADMLPGLAWVGDGLDPWDIYAQQRMLGNTRMDPCSKILKRQISQRWLKANADPAQDIVVVGLDHEEVERFEGDPRRGTPGFKRRMQEEGWRAIAPLCDPPYMTPARAAAILEREGLWEPRLNVLGFAHNNCGGHCCKAGLGHWLMLLKHFPERFYWCAEREQQIMAELKSTSTMLRNRRGGVTGSLSLYALAAREATPVEKADMGGCGCFSG